MYKAIVVGTDGSPTATQAVTHAAELASLAGAALHVVHAYRSPAAVVALDPAFAPIGLDVLNDGSAEHAEVVCAEAALAAEDRGAKVERHVVCGDAAEALIAVAEAVDADLLVVGNRGMSGVRRFLLGSVPNKISHHSPCHLMILHTW